MVSTPGLQTARHRGGAVPQSQATATVALLVALLGGRIYEFAFPVPRETPPMLSTFKPLPAPPDWAVRTRVPG
jgi:hypothetical protein